MKRIRERTWLFGILSLLVMAFIFSRSLHTGSVSGQESMTLVQLLHRWGLPAWIEDDLLDVILRKTGHFTEFAVLGVTVGLFTQSLGALRGLSLRSLPLLICLLTATCDELIQSFVEGRGSMVRDVVLDFCGSAFGVLMILLLFRLRRRKNRQNAL